MSGDAMSGFVTAITGTNGLTEATIWNQITNLAPLIVTVVSVSVGVYFAKKLIKGFGKAKVRM